MSLTSSFGRLSDVLYAYYVRTLRRVPTSTKEWGGGEGNDRKRMNLNGWMGVNG